MDKKISFLFLTAILNFQETLQCGPSVSPSPPKVKEKKPVAINYTEVIKTTHYLQFLKNFETVSRPYHFDRGFFAYLKCNGSYHKEMGSVMHGLCSYCVEMQPTKNNVYWRCMDKCFTTWKTENCLREYEEYANEKNHYVEYFVKELSGGSLKS